MLIRKIKNYAKNRGVKALAVKIKERISYKKSTMEYMKTHRLTKDMLDKQANHKFDQNILISICVPVYNTNKEQLVDMLESVLNQSYSNWELCIADGSSDNCKYVEEIICSYKDDRIKYKKLDKNEGIVSNSNIACSMAVGEYIALLDHDDILSLDALYYVMEQIQNGADYIYSDEASFSKSIEKPDIIHFKPDFSIFNLRGNNYICHLSVFKKELFDKVGGFRAGYDGSQDHDLILRICEIAQNIVHIPRVLYYWRVHPNSVAMDISAKPYCLTTGVKAVESHLERMGINAKVSNAVNDSAVYRVDYKLRIKPVVINNIDNIAGVTQEYVVVVDKRLRLGKNAVTELAKYIQLDNVGVVCGMVVDNNKVQCGGIDISDTIAYQYANTSILSEGYMKRLKYAHSTSAVPPYLFAVKKSLFDAVLGFDENLLRCDRLIDVCIKIKKLGYEIVFNPYSIAYGKVDRLSISEEFYNKIVG